MYELMNISFEDTVKLEYEIITHYIFVVLFFYIFRLLGKKLILTTKQMFLTQMIRQMISGIQDRTSSFPRMNGVTHSFFRHFPKGTSFRLLVG